MINRFCQPAYWIKLCSYSACYKPRRRWGRRLPTTRIKQRDNTVQRNDAPATTSWPEGLMRQKQSSD